MKIIREGAASDDSEFKDIESIESASDDSEIKDINSKFEYIELESLGSDDTVIIDRSN